MVSTGKTYDLNKKYQIQISISYNDSNGIMTAKYYLDGELVKSTNEIAYTVQLSDIKGRMI